MKEDKSRLRLADEFIKGLRGCIKGSKIEPEKLKRIWWMKD